jgi:beta-xylosidase
MDYRAIVKQLISEYAKLKPVNGDIDPSVVFDEANGRYQLLFSGWQKRKRVFAPIIHVDIIGDKVWVQCDNTEDGIVEELIDQGIPKSQIVPAMMLPEARKYYGYPAE